MLLTKTQQPKQQYIKDSSMSFRQVLSKAFLPALERGQLLAKELQQAKPMIEDVMALAHHHHKQVTEKTASTAAVRRNANAFTVSFPRKPVQYC
jgi:hypothetical protein